jgi:hypothetical protein
MQPSSDVMFNDHSGLAGTSKLSVRLYDLLLMLRQVTAVSGSDPSKSGKLRVTRNRSTSSGGGIWTPISSPVSKQLHT